MNPKLSLFQFCAYLLFVAVMALLSILSLGLNESATQLLMKEGGVVESASAVGYFFCIAFLFSIAGTKPLRSHWYVYIILLAMALRELDFDKRFTATGVLKSKFLIADDVGITAKIIGALVLLIVLSALITWIVRHAKPFISGVLRFRSADWAMGFALAFIVLTKSIDGLARKLEPLGVQVTAEINVMASHFEEMFELGIPIILLYAIFQYWRAWSGAD